MSLRTLSIAALTLWTLSACAAPATPLPTAAPPTRAPSATPTAAPSETPTPDYKAIVIAAGQLTTSAPLLSPDGKMRAEVVSYACTPATVEPGSEEEQFSYIELRLVDTASGDIRVAASQLVNCSGLGSWGIKGLFWSANSRFFYYGPSDGGPDGCGFWGGEITRLAVDSLEKATLSGWTQASYAAKIAGWEPADQTVIVWDTETGQTTRTPAKVQPGPAAWSPDGTSLVIVENTTFCPLGGPSTLTRIDLPGGAQTTLTTSGTLGFQSVTWDTPGQLHLLDQDGKPWVFDMTMATLEEEK